MSIDFDVCFEMGKDGDFINRKIIDAVVGIQTWYRQDPLSYGGLTSMYRRITSHHIKGGLFKCLTMIYSLINFRSDLPSLS